jgi:hypothetical protein
MTRLAIDLDKILAACRDAGLDESVQTAIMNLYKNAYREGYADGTTDCEEAHDDGETPSELY